MAQLTENQIKDLTEDKLIESFMSHAPLSYNRYKGDWYQLMQVVKKIEEIEIKEGSYIEVFLGPHNYTCISITDYNKEFAADGLTKVDNLYNSIILFLNWYNTDRISDNIVNNNVLLAEFIDLPRKKFNSGLYNYQFDDKWYESDELAFNKSWDWLLSIIGKISKNCEEPEELDNLKYALLCNDINTAYNFVVDYIKQ